MTRIGLAGLIAILLIAEPLPGSDGSVESRVQRQEFVRHLDLTGDLRALETLQVTSPNLGNKWSFVVSYLIPEGPVVKSGDLLARFDIAELITERLELEKKKEDARIQIAQKQAEQEIEELDLLLNLAQAHKSYRVARLYADIETQLLARSEAEKYRFDADQSQLAIEKAKERLQSREVSARADLNLVQLEYDQAELELRRIQGEIKRMSIRAGSPGLCSTQKTTRAIRSRWGILSSAAGRCSRYPTCSAWSFRPGSSIPTSVSCGKVWKRESPSMPSPQEASQPESTDCPSSPSQFIGVPS